MKTEAEDISQRGAARGDRNVAAERTQMCLAPRLSSFYRQIHGLLCQKTKTSRNKSQLVTYLHTNTKCCGIWFGNSELKQAALRGDIEALTENRYTDHPQS